MPSSTKTSLYFEYARMSFTSTSAEVALANFKVRLLTPAALNCEAGQVSGLAQQHQDQPLFGVREDVVQVYLS